MNRSIAVRNQFLTVLVLSFAAHGAALARDPSAASGAASEASAGSIVGAGSVLVGGSLVALALAGTAVVASVEAVGAGTTVVLRGVSEATTASVRIAGTASLAVGSVVEVVAIGTGCLLVAAGRVVAFVPNEIGRALVHQRAVGATR